jgi:hypothetical protein
VSWLASPACAVSGGTYVAGAGRLRRGRSVEGPLVRLGDDVPAAIRAADAFENLHSLAHANAAFQAFLTGQPSS